MSTLLRVLVGITGIALIVMARKASVTRKFTERQSIFWIFGGLIIILFGIFPNIIYVISSIFGVDYAPSIIYAIAIVLSAYGIFTCYKANAELSSRVQELAMQISLLNEESKLMEKRLEEMTEQSKAVEKAENRRE